MEANLQNAITRLIYSFMQMQVKERVHKSAFVRSTGSGIEIHIDAGIGKRRSREDDFDSDEITKKIGDLKLEALGEAVHLAVEILTNMMDCDPRGLRKDYFTIVVDQDARSRLVFNNKLLKANKIDKKLVAETRVVFHEHADRLNKDIMFVNSENSTVN